MIAPQILRSSDRSDHPTNFDWWVFCTRENFTLGCGMPRQSEVWFVSTVMQVCRCEVNDQGTLSITTLPHPSGYHLHASDINGYTCEDVASMCCARIIENNWISALAQEFEEAVPAVALAADSRKSEGCCIQVPRLVLSRVSASEADNNRS